MLSECKYSYNSKYGVEEDNSVVLMLNCLKHEQLRVSKGIYALKSKYVGHICC